MESGIQLRLVTGADDVRRSFNVMNGLRPNIEAAAEYADRVERQMQQGYLLLGAWRAEEVLGLAGYRHLENLLYGRFTYVDDLVVRPDI